MCVFTVNNEIPFSLSLCLHQSELVAELFQLQGSALSVANGSVRSGKRAARENKLTVAFQVR